MIAWAFDALIGVTVLLLLVLVLRVPVARLFGAEWAYALWLLPLIRLVVSPFDLSGAQNALDLPAYTVIVIPAAAQAADPATGGEGLGLLGYALGLWLAGAALFLFWQQRKYRAFIAIIGEGRRSRPAEHGGIPVVESSGAEGPLAIGLLRPRIIVPLDFSTRYKPAERVLALDHELIHHRRGDLWWNLVALGLLAFNWFNPLAWIAFRAFRADQELACDAAVARRRPLTERLDYACALVKSATAHRLVAACPLNGADQLKERLRMLGEHRVSGTRTAGGMAALAGLAISGIVISGAGFAKEGPARAVTAELIVAHSEGDDPVITAEDVATLAAKCGSEEWDGRVTLETNGGATARQLIRCSNGRTVEDQEVSTILTRTVGRAKARNATAPVAFGGSAGSMAEQSGTGSAVGVKPAEQLRSISQGDGLRREPMIRSLSIAQARGGPPSVILVPSGGSPVALNGHEPSSSVGASERSALIERVRTMLSGAPARAGAARRPEVLELEELVADERDKTERSVPDYIVQVRSLHPQVEEIPPSDGVRFFRRERGAAGPRVGTVAGSL